MQSKKIHNFNKESGLEFFFNEKNRELEIFFTGTYTKECMLVVNNYSFLEAVKQFLQDPNFKSINKNGNILDFGDLEFRYFGEKVMILTKEKLQEKYYFHKKVYLSSENDLILWLIATAENDFSLRRTKKELSKGNVKFKDWKLGHLVKIGTN